MTSSYDLNAVRTAVKLVRLIRSEDVRIVHTFFETSDLWAGTIARLLSRAILVSSRRDMGILRSTKHKVAYRLLGLLAHKVLAVSNQVRQYVISADHVSPDKVATIYNGICIAPRPDRASINALRECLAISEPGGRLIIAVGNIRKIKGFDVLIRAASSVCAQNQKVTFIVVGGISEPGHYRELLQMVRESGLGEKFRFIGAEPDVFPFLYASDIFVLPSRSEGFSNALLEAMAAGLPCIATRVGGNPEAVRDGETGFLVEPENADMLADRISRLLQNPQQNEQMGFAGRERLERQFSSEVMMGSLIAVYENLLGHAPAGRKRSSWAGTQA
jgi:glycosyltransferase involved in cell wall biosynthesis